MENYKTLCFKTKKEALKNLEEIKIHFGTKYVIGNVFKGIDERSNYGYYCSYELNDFYCNGDDGEYNNNKCLEQCNFCKDCERLNNN